VAPAVLPPAERLLSASAVDPMVPENPPAMPALSPANCVGNAGGLAAGTWRMCHSTRSATTERLLSASAVDPMVQKILPPCRRYRPPIALVTPAVLPPAERLLVVFLRVFLRVSAPPR